MTRDSFLPPWTRSSVAQHKKRPGDRIGSRSHKVSLGVFLAMGIAKILLVPTAAAQQIPIVQSGADGRYERQIDPKTAIPGFDASTSKSFRAAVDELVSQLGAMPTVTSPPAPVCHRLMTYIEITPPHGVPAASVSVMSPINFNGGRCSPLTGGGIEFILNRTSAAFERSRANVPGAEDGRANWFVLNPVASGNVIQLRDGTTLITNGTDLLTPVSSRRYATEQMKRSGETPGQVQDPRDRRPLWSIQLARLGADAGERQACLDERGALDTTAACPAHSKVWEVNPDYFDKKRPGAIQLIVLRTPQGPYHGESPERFKARQAVWAALDIARLSALVTR